MKKYILLPLILFGTTTYSISYKKIFWPFAQKAQAIKPRVAVIFINEQRKLEHVAQNLIRAAKSNDILGILLIMHSFGGTADLFSTIHDITKKIAVMKPIICLVAGSALSGGYMIASAAHYIIAHSCSHIGHIGVEQYFYRLKNPKQTGNVEASLDVNIFHAGEFKSIYNEYSGELSQKEKEYIQESINKTYMQFLAMVAQDRHLNLEQYKDWAEGKTFLAPEALQLGLIDEIGTIFDAERKIAEMISLRYLTDTFAQEIDPVFYSTTQEENKS